MMITNARMSPNRAATTPSIGAEISAWNPSRVDGTIRRISHTDTITIRTATTTATVMITVTGTAFSKPRTARPYSSAIRRHGAISDDVGDDERRREEEQAKEEE